MFVFVVFFHVFHKSLMESTCRSVYDNKKRCLLNAPMPKLHSELVFYEGLSCSKIQQLGFFDIAFYDILSYDL